MKSNFANDTFVLIRYNKTKKHFNFLIMSTLLTSNVQEIVSNRFINSPKWKKGERFDYTHEIILHSSKDKIFPLLCPVREYEWFNDWKCTMVYAESGVAENNCIFYTKMGFPLFKKQVFHVIKYEPNENITFLIYINGIATIVFGGTLEQLKNDTCKLTVFYKATGLSGFGNLFLRYKGKKEIEKNTRNIEMDLVYWLENNKKRPKNK
jgi:hypothetical protein